MREKEKWIKDIAEWVKDNEEIDPDSLAMGGQYAWQKPWMKKVCTGKDTYNYQNPPLEVYEYILEGLISIYNSWHHQLANMPSKYDLKIWIFHPEFIRSTVGVTSKDTSKYNEEELIESNEGFPIQLFPGLRSKLDKYEFKSYQDNQIFYMNDMGNAIFWGYNFEEEPPSEEYMLREMTRLRATSKKIQLPDGTTEIKFTIKKGHIWIGTVSKGY